MRIAFVFGLILLLLAAAPSFAAVEPDYDPKEPLVTNPWFAAQGAAEQKADLDFVKGMRPHHAGALTMSDEYLSDPQAKNVQLKSLARGIKHNQTFEIGMLDRVEQLVGKPIQKEGATRQVAEQGLAQKQRFQRAPMPAGFGKSEVTARDVQFAKGMAIHHEAALVMAKEYLANPHATNKYLRLLCLDILRDQKMEIAFMNDIVAQYPGNPDDIKVDMSMMHGMDHMNHGGMKHGAAPKKAKVKKPTAKKPAPAHDMSGMEGMDHSHMGH
ncbi:MAG: DUF305 domain-containing protein [Micavibrio aeruginosavorus]|uniref:DUF305 domain-containing protein n=1 Tax=Micavibrio aeruginosavorus TaxID=349221 RepID=A0A2W5MX94_9BACT|nr:MAG: DUF305 domain-containing protein [Micavibrio aeruginosavorus]